MAVRIRYKVEVAISSASTEEKDLGNLAYEVVNDNVGEGGVRKTLLAAGATDVAIAMTEIAGSKFIFIRTNASDSTETLGTIELKKNGVGGEVYEITPLSGATEAHFLLSTQGVTSLYASNPGTVDVEVTVAIAGD